jgi:phage shock protein A
MASEKQMAAKFAAAQATSDEWLRRAELAVRKGQDELAREALLRRKTFDTAANSLKARACARWRAGCAVWLWLAWCATAPAPA